MKMAIPSQVSYPWAKESFPLKEVPPAPCFPAAPPVLLLAASWRKKQPLQSAGQLSPHVLKRLVDCGKRMQYMLVYFIILSIKVLCIISVVHLVLYIFVQCGTDLNV